MRKIFSAISVLLLVVATASFANGQKESSASSGSTSGGSVKIALLVKNIGNPFFDAIKKGWDEAVAQVGATSIYRGPENPTAQGQIQIMNELIAQHVNGITYAANDPQALKPVAVRAMKAGIFVDGWESGIVAGSRNIAVEPASAQSIGAGEVQMMYDEIGGKGEIAILSAAPTMSDQNTWIKYMKEELAKPKYAQMKLVTIVYGNDEQQKSYNVALGLFQAYPNLAGIISPTTVGIEAAARAITDKGLIGKVQLTGLGLPSQMAPYVKSGACKVFGLWNPIDLGYLNAYITYLGATKKITGAPGETFTAGRLGKYTIEKEPGVSYGLVYLGKLFKFNAGNIDKFKSVF